MRKPAFCICENKNADQLISAFVFTTQIVQSLYFLNLKFQASSHLLWLYSPVCVGPGRKPRRTVFSQQGSYCTIRCPTSTTCISPTCNSLKHNHLGTNAALQNVQTSFTIFSFFDGIFFSLDRIPFHPPSLIGAAVDLLTL